MQFLTIPCNNGHITIGHRNCLIYDQKDYTMADLKSCEILDELKKLGIDLPSDVIEYLREYTAYCTCHDKSGKQESEKT